MEEIESEEFNFAAVRFGTDVEQTINKIKIVPISNIENFKLLEDYSDYPMYVWRNKGKSDEAIKEPAQILRIAKTKEELTDIKGKRIPIKKRRSLTDMIKIIEARDNPEPVVKTKKTFNALRKSAKENSKKKTKADAEKKKKDFEEIMDRKFKATKNPTVSFLPNKSDKTKSMKKTSNTVPEDDQVDQETLSDNDSEILKKNVSRSIDVTKASSSKSSKNDMHRGKRPLHLGTEITDRKRTCLADTTNLLPRDNKSHDSNDDLFEIDKDRIERGEKRDDTQGSHEKIDEPKKHNDENIEGAEHKEKGDGHSSETDEDGENLKKKVKTKVRKQRTKFHIDANRIEEIRKEVLAEEELFEKLKPPGIDNMTSFKSDNKLLFHTYYNVTFSYSKYKIIKNSTTPSMFVTTAAKAIWPKETLKKKALNLGRCAGADREPFEPEKLAALHRMYFGYVMKSVPENFREKEIINCNSYLNRVIANLRKNL